MRSEDLSLSNIKSKLTTLKKLKYNKTTALRPWKIHWGQENPSSRDYDDPFWEPTISDQANRSIKRPESDVKTEGNTKKTSKNTLRVTEAELFFSLCTTFKKPEGACKDTVLLLSLGNSSSLEALNFLYGPEALLYIDGIPYHGVDPNHTEIMLPTELTPDKEHTLTLQGWSGIKNDLYTIQPPLIAQIDLIIQNLYTYYSAVIQTIENLPDESSILRSDLIAVLEESYKALELCEPIGSGINHSSETAFEILLQGLKNNFHNSNRVSIAAIGHAHLDIAWLWDISQAKQKAVQTFTNVLRLMEKNPEFVFSCSQPQLYEYIQKEYPSVFQQIKKRVSEGRWELLGGMWVEADCNISGAEALARQFLLGRSYFSQNFDSIDTDVLWLPDVFGYAWQLPQLMKESEISGFVTAKLSWNQVNQMPFETFWWKGLDGSQVLTSLITTKKPGWWGATYSGEMNPQEVLSTYKTIQHKELCKEIIMPYGLGDGGGGPTQSMLNQMSAINSIPSLPKVTPSTVNSYFEKLKKLASSKQFPSWNGELYLELHRGTYTTQAKNKRNNRKCEFLLHNAEFLAAWSTISCSAPYPKQKINEAWKLLCLNQFHDILPGSAIHEVYEQSDKDYAAISTAAQDIIETSLSTLDSLIPDDAFFVIYNPTSFEVSQLVLLPEKIVEKVTAIYTSDGGKIAVQKTSKGLLLDLRSIPPYGYRAFFNYSAENNTQTINPLSSPTLMSEISKEDSFLQEKVSIFHEEGELIFMENAFIKAAFNSAGEILSLFDKENRRENIPKGQKGNTLRFFEDRPLDWDAWDIDIFYEKKPLEFEVSSSITVIEEGPLRTAIEVTQKVHNSSITQRIYLGISSRKLEFETACNWNESHLLLKAFFPTTILSPKITCEIQWGNVERPTHRNTSWDEAKFEISAHKWIDISEGNYGISLLNDCKYGHSVIENTISLTLLRSPTFPDKYADRGNHLFTYSILPHSGDWREITAKEAYSLNNPCIVHKVEQNKKSSSFSNKIKSSEDSFISTSYDGTIIETVKLSEKSQELVVRLYEYKRTRKDDVIITLPKTTKNAYLSNILERDQHHIKSLESENTIIMKQNKAHISVNPYQILTLKASI